MKSNYISRHPAPWLTGLLCAVFLAVLGSPAIAGGKRHHSGHGRQTHHYNSHYRGHSHGHRVYSYGYRGHRSYGHSNYGRSRHSSLIIRLLGL